MKIPMFGKAPDTSVIIYGRHCESWMKALAPESGLWQKLPYVKQVLIHEQTDTVNLKSIPQCKRAVILPLMEVHTLKCPRQFRALVPDKRCIEIFADKLKFSDYTEKNSLSSFCPVSYKDKAQIEFPCVLKRADLNAGVGIELVCSGEQLESLLSQHPWTGHPYILQSYVSGSEFVTHCVCKKGKILWHCTYHYELPDRVINRPGVAVRQNKSTISDENLKVIESFLRPLKYSGPLNVDYKLNQNGEVSIFEINPRLGGSLMSPDNHADLSTALDCIISNARPRTRFFPFFVQSV